MDGEQGGIGEKEIYNHYCDRVGLAERRKTLILALCLVDGIKGFAGYG